MSHIPVMLRESLEIFAEQKVQTFFDGTLGAGGFAHAFLEAHPEIECYIGCDRDTHALELAKKKLADFGQKVRFVHSNFSALDVVLKDNDLQKVDGFFLI